MPPASLSRYARHNRSLVNRAANRLLKAEGVFALAVGCIGQRVRQEEAALGRELLPDELEAVCERVEVEDLLGYVTTYPNVSRASCAPVALDDDGVIERIEGYKTNGGISGDAKIDDIRAMDIILAWDDRAPDDRRDRFARAFDIVRKLDAYIEACKG